MVNIEQLTELYFSTDEPVPYNLKCGVEILIHPIKVKNWTLFSNCLGILTIEKNEINDIEVIKMSYLDFLINAMKQDETIASRLVHIFRLSIKEDKISIEQNKGKNVLAMLDEDNIIKGYITSKEFDEIKKIILFQNIYDYDDRYISPDVKELYNTYIKAMNKNQEDPTLERKKVFVMGKTGNSIKELNEMSYRMFNQLYTTNVEIDLYYARKMIQASQKYEVKEDIIYPLFEKKKDKYECIFTSTNTLAEKGIVGAEQLNNIKDNS